VIGLFLAWAFTLSPPRGGQVFGLILIAATLALTFLAVQNPRTLYHEGLSSLSRDVGGEMSSKFQAGSSNIAFDWTRMVPSLSARAAELRNWVPLAFWIPAALGINLLWLKRRRADGKSGRKHGRLALFPDVAFVLVLGISITAYRFFDVRLKDGFRLDDGKIALFAQDQNCLGWEGSGFWIRGSSRAFLAVRTERPVSEFQITLSSPVEGETKIRLGTYRRRIRRRKPAGPPEETCFPSPRGIRWKEGYLYSLEVEESSGFFPYQVDRNSKDRRHLGVFVRLSSRFR
jgi:hypothetical protein